MPHIVVISDNSTERTPTVVHRERVSTPHLQSNHSATQLVERLAWAVADAEAIEDERPHDPPPPAADTPKVRAGEDGWFPV